MYKYKTEIVLEQGTSKEMKITVESTELTVDLIDALINARRLIDTELVSQPNPKPKKGILGKYHGRIKMNEPYDAELGEAYWNDGNDLI